MAMKFNLFISANDNTVYEIGAIYGFATSAKIVSKQ